MSFSMLSLNKTKPMLGTIVDLSQEPEDGDESNKEHGSDSVEGANCLSGQSRTDRKYLLSQARSFRDFENLFVALDGLERWRDAEKQMAESVLPLSEMPSSVLTIGVCTDSQGSVLPANRLMP